MATRVEVIPVTVNAHIAPAAAIIVPLPFSDGRVDMLEIVIPDGPSGLVGFQVRHSQQVIIPYSGNAFIVGNNEVIHWPLETFPEANAWDTVIYNNDVYMHTITFRFLVTDVIMTPSLPPLVAIGV